MKLNKQDTYRTETLLTYVCIQAKTDPCVFTYHQQIQLPDGSIKTVQLSIGIHVDGGMTMSIGTYDAAFHSNQENSS